MSIWYNKKIGGDYKMIKRLRDGLFNPSGVIAYKNDRWWMMPIFTIFLAILGVLPNIAYTLGATKFSYDDRNHFANEFRMEYVPFQIVDGELVNKDDNDEYVYRKKLLEKYIVQISVQSTPKVADSLTLPIIYLEKDGVYVEQALFSKEKLFSYADYTETMNLDLEKVISGDYEVWSKVEIVINHVLNKNFQMQSYFMLFTEFVMSALELLGLSAFLALMQKMYNSNLKFMKLWKLLIYVMSPLVVGQLINSLYGVYIAWIIGIIISMLYAAKISRQMSFE